MKNQALLLLIAIVIIVSGAAVYFSGSFTGGQVYTSGGQSCVLKESGAYFAAPFYGYYSCQANSATPSTNLFPVDNLGWGNWQKIISCPTYNTGLTKQCSIVAQGIGTSFFGLNTARVWYAFCDSPSSCGTDAGSILVSSSTGVPTTITTIQSGQYIKLHGGVGVLYNPIEVLQVGEIHTSYGLWQYERGLPAQVSSTNCDIPPTADQCIDCKLPTGIDGEPNTLYNKAVTSLKPDEFSTYLKDWIATIYGKGGIATYQGKQVECSMRQVYSIQTIQLESGCYAFPNTKLADVTCCPGDVAGSQSCGADFQWHIQDVGCVKNGIPSIVVCDGQGGWKYISSDPTLYHKATACNSDGSCTYSEVRTVCSPIAGCSAGATCVVDNLNPANNHCEGGVNPCGDANQDCFDDCTNQQIQGCTPQNQCASKDQKVTLTKACCTGLNPDANGFCRETPEWIIWLPVIMFTALGLLVGYAYPKRDKIPFATVGALSGFMLGLVIQYLLTNTIWVWVSIAIGILLGILILYKKIVSWF